MGESLNRRSMILRLADTDASTDSQSAKLRRLQEYVRTCDSRKLAKLLRIANNDPFLR